MINLLETDLDLDRQQVKVLVKEITTNHSLPKSLVGVIEEYRCKKREEFGITTHLT